LFKCINNDECSVFSDFSYGVNFGLIYDADENDYIRFNKTVNPPPLNSKYNKENKSNFLFIFDTNRTVSIVFYLTSSF